MKTYEGNLKIIGEIERRMAWQQFENLSSVALMIVVQLLIAAFLIVATIVLPAHAAAESEHPLGDHPAVIVFKKWNQSEYTSRTAVYPHPATIWWYMQDPNPKAPDHPLPGTHP